MKNHIIISLLILSVGLSQKEYNGNDLIEMDNGLWTEKFSDEPITGKVYGISIGVGVAITFGVALDNIAIGISIGLEPVSHPLLSPEIWVV